MSYKKKILISGTSSGLGFYLHKNLNSFRFVRNTSFNAYKNKEWDIIIHCGFYSGNNFFKNLANIYWSYKISRLHCKKFIFMSSSLVSDTKVYSYYKCTKKICEYFFNEKKSAVLRLGSIIGWPIKKNTFYKLFLKNKPVISLSKKSIYSFVSYAEILNFIKLIIKKDLHGIFNFLRNDYRSLGFICKKLKIDNVIFGNFIFQCTKISNIKIKKYINLQNESSIDILKRNKKFFLNHISKI